MSASISKVYAREVLDSRGNPTVEVELNFEDGSSGRGIVPSGASTGEHEALELRDKDPKRYLGKGVQKAVYNVNNKVAKILEGKSFSDIYALDKTLLEADGTEQKSELGANAILGASLAYANALANQQKRPLFELINEWMDIGASELSLPVPLMNVLNGGEHANNPLEIQEFMIVPHGFEFFSDSLRAGCEVFHHLKKMLNSQGHSTAVGDEGGFAPNLKSNKEALEVVCAAILNAGYEPGKQISLALDVAASSFFDRESKLYNINLNAQEKVSPNELLSFYSELLEAFPIVSIEDGLDENDWSGWAELTKSYGSQVQLVGDDLFVTNKKFVQKGIETQCANAVLIKVNQIGSLSETLETMKLCREAQYKAVTSHRSGETEDVTISHLAVGSGCGQIKTGSLSRGERTAKYNELLRIEDNARHQGKAIAFSQLN